MSAAPRATPASGAPPVIARRRLITDRLARAIVTAGGLAIVASILGILLFIVCEVWPVFRPTRVSARGSVPVAGAPVAALLADEHRSQVVTLGLDGILRTLAFDGQGEPQQVALLPMAAARDAGSGRNGGPSPFSLTPEKDGLVLRCVHAALGGSMLAAATSDGRVVLGPVCFRESFTGSVRSVTAELRPSVVLPVDPLGRPIDVFWAEMQGSGAAFVVAQLADRSIVWLERKVEENSFTGEVAESLERHLLSAPQPLSQLVCDQAGRNVYGGTERGDLLWWHVENGLPGAAQVVGAGNSAITALSLLIGDRSLVVGQRNGSLSVWLRVRDEAGGFRLVRARDFPAHASAILRIAPSRRGRVFMAADQGGTIGVYQSTAGRTLWVGAAPCAEVAALTLAPRGDGAFVCGAGRVFGLDLDCPHPELSLAALFAPVWYEDAPGPEQVWQSTGGTDDFEPKLSLTPLLVGTLKGTFYSLLLAIPIAVLAAMYASQFMHPSLKRRVKPVVEIMAALPSVVLGFLAGLWLAPRVERVFPALLLMVVVLPAVVIGTGTLWSLVPRRIRGRLAAGSEVFLFAIALLAAGALCLALDQRLGAALFGSSFSSWLLAATGMQYDQRNAIVVGLAMGFAVIPIIFAIAEDAFSNVPPSLIAGSLALGADRWQTVTRVVLPTASPGIFSGIMVGFGRAVGETMIVLMATGNTPIMSWSPFNGFRTLSANIATEVPEAPHGSTLYRTLFLAALLLFALTFLVNTVAELVRQRLRRRYAQL
ncbi:MAG: ABC transporter permease subunit [Planctomycetota bacterium]